jgi:hypothetical protein
VKISGWLVICTLFLALFLGFSKRRTELSSLGSEAGKHRSTLKKYNVVQLDLYLSICATLAVVSYTMYTVSDWSRAQVGFDGLLTLPFVIVGIFRYLHLITQRTESADPSALLFRDWPMLAVVAVWGVSWLYLKGVNPQILKGIIVL